jgi:cytochrome c553
MRKWVPFVFLILILFILVEFLLSTGRTNEYLPQSSDPSLVFKQACAECHGEQGEGNGMLYPDLTKEMLSERGVKNIVRNGDLFMPAFPNIPDRTLQKLAAYVAEKKFRIE